MDIGKGLSQSFDVYKENVGTLIVAALVAVILSSACFLIAGPVMLGFILLCRKTIRKEKAEIGELFAHFDQFVPTLILSLIVFVPLIILAVIPVIQIVAFVLMPAASMVWYFGMLAIADENLAPMDAIKKGIAMLQKDLVGNWIYSLVICIVSSICSFITMPIGTIAMIYANDELKGSTEVPPTNATPSI